MYTDPAYEDGYKAGHREGMQEGFKDGYKAGVEAAQTYLMGMRITELDGIPQVAPTEMDTAHIKTLNLNMRVYNSLLRGRITTIGELIRLSEEDLLEIRMLGHTSVAEIKARIEHLGYKLAPAVNKDWRTINA